jgi:hypothetical protein
MAAAAGLLGRTQDVARTRITSSVVAGCMDVEFFVHHGNGAFSATRYEAMQLGAEHRLHAWITLRDAAGEVIHHEVSCNPSALHSCCMNGALHLMRHRHTHPDHGLQSIYRRLQPVPLRMGQDLNLGLLDSSRMPSRRLNSPGRCIRCRPHAPASILAAR